jgi:hypothetical protein
MKTLSNSAELNAGAITKECPKAASGCVKGFPKAADVGDFS